MAASGPVYRAVMAFALFRARALGLDPGVRAALSKTALGRPSAEERDWIERIEATRHTLPDAGDDAAMSTWQSIAPVWGRLLLTLARELRPTAAIELGTGFGLSGAYIAAGLELNGQGRLVSLEGNPGWADVARRRFAELGLGERAEVRVGRIDDTLEASLADAGAIGLAFLDADHGEAPTSGHFERIRPRLAPGAAVVVDDINWGEGMQRAWAQIAGSDGAASAVGLRRLGIVAMNR